MYDYLIVGAGLSGAIFAYEATKRGKKVKVTAAAVITSKLGGSAASLTTYTLIANIGAAIAVPILSMHMKHLTVVYVLLFLMLIALKC